MNNPVAFIHLDAIQRNIDLVRAAAPKCKVMAVVKAQAYGHGAARVCQSVRGVDAFAIARPSEGVALREADVALPILVLEGVVSEQELDLCRINRLTPVLHSEYEIALLKGSRHRDMAIWLKVDTGMHRLGLSPEDFRRGMTTGESLNIVGVMSHMANSEDTDRVSNAEQIEIFGDLTHNLDCELSLANSGAILNYRDSYFDWVRPGLMLYGGSPGGHPDHRLAAAMTLTAPVVAINTLLAGESIGYGSAWTAPIDCRVAVIGIGYGDGYPRETPEGTPVLVNGQRRGLVGRISMDMSFVLLDPEDALTPGDQVTLWGPALPVDEVAAHVGTLSYRLLSGLTERVVRNFDGPG